MMLDLDHFKQVNDEYGHHVGDQVLQKVAKRCRESLRSIDIIGRYGGEEFAIFLPETDLDAAWKAAERIRFSMAGAPFLTTRGPVRVTVSIGVAALQETMRDFAALLNRADALLLNAKGEGRNRVLVA